MLKLLFKRFVFEWLGLQLQILDLDSERLRPLSSLKHYDQKTDLSAHPFTYGLLVLKTGSESRRRTKKEKKNLYRCIANILLTADFLEAYSNYLFQLTMNWTD